MPGEQRRCPQCWQPRDPGEFLSAARAGPGRWSSRTEACGERRRRRRRRHEDHQCKRDDRSGDARSPAGAHRARRSNLLQVRRQVRDWLVRDVRRGLPDADQRIAKAVAFLEERKQALPDVWKRMEYWLDGVLDILKGTP